MSVRLERLEALLQTCNFVAIDCEMTGISLDENTRPTIDDTPNSRYQKCSRIASKFSLMQVGVCPFESNGDDGFIASPFTFYVLADTKTGAPLVMYQSTLAFHAKNDFDFNAWLKCGVPFMSEATYEEVLARITTEPEPRERRERGRQVGVGEVDEPEGEADHGEVPEEHAHRVGVRALEAVRRDALAEAALGDLIARLLLTQWPHKE